MLLRRSVISPAKAGFITLAILGARTRFDPPNQSLTTPYPLKGVRACFGWPFTAMFELILKKNSKNDKYLARGSWPGRRDSNPLFQAIKHIFQLSCKKFHKTITCEITHNHLQLLIDILIKIDFMERLLKRLEFQPHIAHKVYGLITKIEELKGQWKAGTSLSPQVLNRLKKSVIITSAGASTRIEEARLSDSEVEKLLKGLKIQKLRTRDQQEVASYAELLTNIFNSYQSINLSEATIKHFHAELLKYSEKDTRHRGHYKFGSNRVEARNSKGEIVGVLFDPTPPHLVQKEMQELIQWTIDQLEKNEIHPLILIGAFIFEFLSIHPFQDGNGRTSRVLTNLLLLKNGYEYMPCISHEKLIEDNKENYYIALNKSRKNWKTKSEDISPWLLYFLEILLGQTERAIDLLSSETIEHFLSEKQLAIWNRIQEKKIVTPKELRIELEMPTATVLQALNKLLDMKKVERIGEGRATRYRLL